MWIYDGEEWMREGVGSNETKQQELPRPEEMFYPELQVVEITPVPLTNYVPPMPVASRRTEH